MEVLFICPFVCLSVITSYSFPFSDLKLTQHPPVNLNHTTSPTVSNIPHPCLPCTGITGNGNSRSPLSQTMNCNFAQNLFCASMVHSRKRKLGVIFFIQRLPRHPYEGIGSLGSLGVSNHELEYSPNHRSVHLWNFVFSNVVFPF